MDWTTQKPLPAEELNQANLANAVVYGPDQERIGAISHLHNLGSGTHVAIDVGGFLGFGSKVVLVALGELTMVRGADGIVYGVTERSKDALLALPEHRD